MFRTKAGRGATGNATWIEPTAHTLVALKKVASHYRTAGSGTAGSRWRGSGLEPPLHRWRLELRNSEHAVFRSAFVSGDHGAGVVGAGWARVNVNLRERWIVAQRFRAETKSSLGKAWLQIALRCHGRDVAAPAESAGHSHRAT